MYRFYNDEMRYFFFVYNIYQILNSAKFARSKYENCKNSNNNFEKLKIKQSLINVVW